MTKDTNPEAAVRITRVSLWSVFRVSFLTAAIASLGLIFTIVLLFVVFQKLGYVQTVAKGVSDLLGVPVRISVLQAVLFSFALACMVISMSVFFAVISAYVFNLSSSVVGGLVFLTHPEQLEGKSKPSTATPKPRYIRKPRVQSRQAKHKRQGPVNTP